MLVLTRNAGQKVLIQTPKGEIEVTFLSREGNCAKIGVHGPRGIPIVRDDTYEHHSFCTLKEYKNANNLT